ncbi:MAG: hypothetical protein HZB75_03020 [Candidatus Saccharibacteria bacterium]|nr:MAG: hypothetical protein HZB75_03020 [Candidatus Saccharibacteria bacterium]
MRGQEPITLDELAEALRSFARGVPMFHVEIGMPAPKWGAAHSVRLLNTQGRPASNTFYVTDAIDVRNVLGTVWLALHTASGDGIPSHVYRHIETVSDVGEFARLTCQNGTLRISQLD